MKQARINLSIPRDVLDRVTARAKAEDRSVSNLVAHLVRRGLEPPAPATPPAAAAPGRRLTDDDFVAPR
jgi:hypothetical protein